MGNSGFDLDLQAVEDEIDENEEARVILGVLDGTTPAEERAAAVGRGHVLVLAIDGDLNELAADLAPAVKRRDGHLVHFREFLVVAPADVQIDTDEL
jgi:hypothetical protein